MPVDHNRGYNRRKCRLFVDRNAFRSLEFLGCPLSIFVRESSNGGEKVYLPSQWLIFFEDIFTEDTNTSKKNKKEYVF